MPVECENLLKKFLTLSPSERSTLEETMKDPWMNMVHEEELKPYIEPLPDYKDPWHN